MISMHVMSQLIRERVLYLFSRWQLVFTFHDTSVALSVFWVLLFTINTNSMFYFFPIILTNMYLGGTLLVVNAVDIS